MSPLSSLWAPGILLAGLFGMAAICAWGLACAFVLVTLQRKKSYPWINVLFVIAAGLSGWELFQYAVTSHAHASATIWASRATMSLTMLALSAAGFLQSRRIGKSKGFDELHAVSQKLLYSTRLFEKFMTELPALAYTQDAAGRLTYVNKPFADLLQISVHEMSGKRYTDWLPDDVAARLTKNDQLVLDSWLKHQFIEDLVVGGKSTTWLSIKFPLISPEGEPSLGGVSMEITEQLESQAMHSLLASMVELSPDAIYCGSDQGVLTSWNRGAQLMFGYTAEEAVGMAVSNLAPADRQDEAAQFITRLEAGEQILDQETVCVAKDGTPRNVLISAAKIPSFSGTGFQYASLTKDITVMKQSEKQVKALNEELKRRFDELSQTKSALETARDEALESSTLKSAFVARISHELRTPLSVILGMSEFGLLSRWTPDVEHMVTIIHNSAQALLTIVNDILDLTRLEEGSITLTEQLFDPQSVISECLDLMSPAAAAKNLELRAKISAELPRSVIGDAPRLRQVLFNLLGNAIKFTHAGHVSLEAFLSSESETEYWLGFTVRDTGIGIASSDQQHLFDPFFRAEELRLGGVGGTGLGLAICKRFVQLMKGEIGCQSASGKGSAFWIVVPFKKVGLFEPGVPPVTSAPQEPALFELLSHHRVLVVEDNPTIRQLMMRQLEHIGITADSADTGQGALDKASRNRYDVVLLDVHLPDISGYEVAQRMRAGNCRGAGGQKTIIVAQTAGAMAGDREKAIDAGMDDYLAKPISLSALRNMLVRWLSDRPPLMLVPAPVDTAHPPPL